MPTTSEVPLRRARRSLWALGVRGTVVTYLVALIVVPTAAIAARGLSDGPGAFAAAIAEPVAWHAIRLTLWTSALVAVINAVLGTLTAFVLVRYRFRGRAALNAVIDFPFAVPTLVTGIMLVELFGPAGVLGQLLERQGLEIITRPPAIVLALLFVTLPFVVRAVQPVLEELDPAQEEAAQTLGASRARTFATVVLPALVPAIRAGALLSFARALGEFGSVVIVSGSIPFATLFAPVHIAGEIEAGNLTAAAAVATFLLLVSFGVMLGVSLLARRERAHG